MSAAGPARSEEAVKHGSRKLSQPYAEFTSEAAYKKSRVAQKLGTPMAHNAAAKAHQLASTAQFSGLQAAEHREQARLHRTRAKKLRK